MMTDWAKQFQEAMAAAWKQGYDSGTTYGIAYQAGAHSALEDGATHNPYESNNNGKH